MKRTLLFIAWVVASVSMLGQDVLAVEDIKNSGCLSNVRGEEAEEEPLPTIVLTKEGSVLSVQVLNYESNCGTVYFDVTSTVSGGSNDEACSVNISVNPCLSDGDLPDCLCLYNVSFTVRDVEANNFYLNCWWYKGLVELGEGEPLILEDIWEYVSIDAQKYLLRKALGKAMLADATKLKGEVRILSELNYEGKVYSVTSIDPSAFKENKNLTKVIIPRTIKNMDLSNNVGIDSNPFSGCTALQSIEVEDGNPAVCSVDGVLFNREKTKLIAYPAGSQRTSYAVPEGVTSVGGLAFSYSQKLKSVSLYDEITSLGYSAFYGCKSLVEVRLSSKLKVLASNLFGNCQGLKSITIPHGITYLGNNAFSGCNSLLSVIMPESITSTDHSVFENCTSLESMVLSPNLETIAYGMFRNCSSLKEVLIPEGISMISSNVFENCSALTSLDLPESVNRLGSMVFAGCNLSSLYIRGIIDSKWMDSNIFRDMGTQTELYVNPSEVEKFKAIYKGPVYPLDDMAYYYYKGNKVPLTQNENKAVVSIPKNCNEIIERFLANIQTLAMIQDETFAIYVVLRSEYEKLTTLDFWAKDTKSVILTSSYFTENNEEVFATPYLNVRLKKAEDIDLLTSYAEQYKLTIVNNSPLMPLWYVLAVTPESEKSPLACANELYESRYFSESVPDLTSVSLPQMVYRPFVEDDKVWKVGAENSGNPVQWIEYHYFDGDTIIDGRTCKQMMRQRYISPDFPYYNLINSPSLLSYMGAWYEEDKRVYFCSASNNQFKLMYDFSIEANDTVQIDDEFYVIGARQMGGIKGFKGAYRDVMMCKEGGRTVWSTPWLEGVGGICGMTTNVIDGELADPAWFLMACAVGDEVIYFNDEFEDGASPEEARKHRFDFTHTIKTKPKAPMRREAEKQSLYGEYNEQRLDINLSSLDDTYQVRITDETDKVVYEKTVNAGSIVGLDIDISSFPEGRYTVTMENSHESFTGEFEAIVTGIEVVRSKRPEVRSSIYNPQGQRIGSLQKGLNIVNGKKTLRR